MTISFENTMAIFGFVWFVYACYLPEMIFAKLSLWMERNLPQWMHKPLFECPVCMSIWYGTPFGIALGMQILSALFAAACAGGLSYVVIRVCNAIDNNEN
jgi:hypothetical protein